MTEKQETSPSYVPACGRRLKRTREELGLSIDDVAAELHLSHFQIEALEADDWDRLPGTTYARGYLRSYARLLGLDAEQLLSEASTQEIELSRVEPVVAAKKPEKKQPAPPRSAGTPAPETAAREKDIEHSASSRAPWGWILGIVLVGTAVVAVLQYRVPERITGLLEGIGAGMPVMTAAPEEETDVDDANEVSGYANGDPEPIDASGTRTVSNEVQNQDRPATPTAPEVIVFEFDERSWIDVRDASGERLLYRDFQPGRRIEIEGRPPFKVFLGNARGVQVEYLGQIVEPESDPGRIYARFVLGAASG